jgi:primary-amine oxidase
VHKGKPVQFKFIALLEPPKELLVPYLNAEREGGGGAVIPPRIANMLFSVGTGAELEWLEALFNYATGKLTETEVAPEHKPPVDYEEIIECEKYVIQWDLSASQLCFYPLSDMAFFGAEYY